jgi:hypothetical protein
MDHGPQSQPPPKPAPTGSSIQAAADVIVALIEAERVNAAAVARDQLHKLERMFIAFQHQAITTHAANEAQLADAHQNIKHMQSLLAQSQPAGMLLENASQLAVIQPSTHQYDTEALRAEISRATADVLDARKEEALAKRQLDDLQTALQRVGIRFSPEENSLHFEAGWAVVLAEIESSGRTAMNPDELHQMLGNLIRKLQGDREKINELEQRLLSSDREREQMANSYETALALLRQDFTTTQDLVTSNSSEQHINSFQSNDWPPPISQVTALTHTSSQVPNALPVDQPSSLHPGRMSPSSVSRH